MIVPPLVYRLLLYFVPMVLSLGVHEFAHAWSAHLLGDDTARERGRMTLNPIVHLDTFGTLVLPALSILATGVAFYGWAKPTPINPARFRRSVSVRLGIAVTAVAGPLSNVLLGLASGLALGLLRRLEAAPGSVASLLVAFMSVNAGLAVFNLLPIPPLDGSRVLFGILPPRAAARFASVGALAPLLILAIVALPAANAWVFLPAERLLLLFRSLATVAGGIQ